MSLLWDEYARNSLDRLPIEVKAVVVRMVAQQDEAYRSQFAYDHHISRSRNEEPRLNGILQIDLAEGEAGATPQICTEAKNDKRRQWRRNAAEGISSLFRLNNEFAGLAAQYRFTTFRANALANPDRMLLPERRLDHFDILDLIVLSYNYKDGILALQLLEHLPNVVTLRLCEEVTDLLSEREFTMEEGFTSSNYLLKLLDQNAYRFTCVEICSVYCSWTEVCRAFPKMESLVIRGGEIDDPDWLIDLLNAIIASPALERLDLTLFEVSIEDASSMTGRDENRIDIGVAAAETRAQKAAQTPLKHLVWQLSEFTSFDFDFFELFAPTLESIEIGYQLRGDVCTAIGGFDALHYRTEVIFPQLRSITIAGAIDMEECLPNIFKRFQSSPIAHFSLSINNIPSEIVRSRFAENRLLSVLGLFEKSLKSVTLASRVPFRHLVGLCAIQEFCTKHEIHLFLHDIFPFATPFIRDDFSELDQFEVEESDQGSDSDSDSNLLYDVATFEDQDQMRSTEDRHSDAIDAQLFSVLRMALGECDRAEKMEDDRAIYESIHDLDMAEMRERFLESLD